MASGVDRGWTRGWSPIAQGIYVLFMMWGLLYAVIGGTGAWNAHFSGADTAPSVVTNGYFLLMTLVMFAFAIARVLEAEKGWSFVRSGTAVAGIAALYLGARSPHWLLRDRRLAGIERAFGLAGVRLIYALIGLAALLGAVTGWPALLLH